MGNCTGCSLLYSWHKATHERHSLLLSRFLSCAQIQLNCYMWGKEKSPNQMRDVAVWCGQTSSLLLNSATTLLISRLCNTLPAEMASLYLWFLLSVELFSGFSGIVITNMVCSWHGLHGNRKTTCKITAPTLTACKQPKIQYFPYLQ